MLSREEIKCVALVITKLYLSEGICQLVIQSFSQSVSQSVSKNCVEQKNL